MNKYNLFISLAVLIPNRSLGFVILSPHSPVILPIPFLSFCPFLLVILPIPFLSF